MSHIANPAPEHKHIRPNRIVSVRPLKQTFWGIPDMVCIDDDGQLWHWSNAPAECKWPHGWTRLDAPDQRPGA
jgi:hypothetical protein